MPRRPGHSAYCRLRCPLSGAACLLPKPFCGVLKMGWSFRRSISLGPFRINFSKSGISYSFGLAGFRTGVNSKGRKYSSVSIPGTGLRYQKSHGSGKKKTAESPAE